MKVIIERGAGWVRVGPLVLGTWSGHKARERNAFEIGMGARRHLDDQTPA